MMLLALENSDLMMMAGVALITLVLMINLRKKYRKGGRAASADSQEQLTSREKIERIKQTAGMKDDLRSMMVELEDLTRRFGSQLDARAMKIEKLLREADERVKQLEQLTGQTVSRRAEPMSEQPEPDDLTRKVTRLSDQGKGPGEIAAALEEHIGKIELILALRQQEKAARR
jgi:hypothetical protein